VQGGFAGRCERCEKVRLVDEPAGAADNPAVVQATPHGVVSPPSMPVLAASRVQTRAPSRRNGPTYTTPSGPTKSRARSASRCASSSRPTMP
jgi:hypothetical protein